MKAFISLDKLFLLIFLCIGSLANGQGVGTSGDISHLVIEDLEETQLTCNRIDNDINFNFCVSIANPPLGNEPDMYLGYTILGVEYPPHYLDFNDFTYDNHDNIYRLCVTSATITVPEECINQVVLKLLKKADDRINYDIYPIYSYNGTGQIFDCIRFEDVDCGNFDLCADTAIGPGAGSPQDQLCPAYIVGDLNLCCADFRNSSNNENTNVTLINDQLLAEVKATPNPFSENLQIEYLLSSPETVNIGLVDITGRTIYTTAKKRNSGKHQETISTSGLAKGVYYLNIQTLSEAKSVKLIKL